MNTRRQTSGMRRIQIILEDLRCFVSANNNIYLIHEEATGRLIFCRYAAQNETFMRFFATARNHRRRCIDITRIDGVSAGFSFTI